MQVTRYDAATRLGSLRDEAISAASAEQRKGRAGRVAPGLCYRLWPASVMSRPKFVFLIEKWYGRREQMVYISLQNGD